MSGQVTGSNLGYVSEWTFNRSQNILSSTLLFLFLFCHGGCILVNQEPYFDLSQTQSHTHLYVWTLDGNLLCLKDESVMEQTMNMTLGSLSPSEIVEIKNQLMLLQDHMSYAIYSVPKRRFPDSSGFSMICFEISWWPFFSKPRPFLALITQ